tara:strand:+ start:53 stop:427 length:375 start_codon:yes stop_codon:yes gene_type:complete
MPSLIISEVNTKKYECEQCLRDWIMVAAGQDSRRLEDSGYFCPYCGTKHTADYPREELPRFIDDAEVKPTFTIKTEEKTPERLKAEDSLTQKRCPDGGWWNPITERCQGEGVGHNLELDNDDQV